VKAMLGRALTAWVWALVAGLSLACSPPPRGAVDADGYRHDDYAYRVVPLGDGGLMPAAWKLDNFYLEANEQGKQVLKAKEAKGYVSEYRLDQDGDGEFEAKVDELTYDLRFENRVHAGVVFLRTIPISSNLRQKKLSVLMDQYVEQIAGAGYELVSLNRGQAVVVEKRYAAKVVAQRNTSLAGREALLTVLDVANVDQLKVDPKARHQRVELVLLHTNFAYKPRLTSETAQASAFPVVMFLGYANLPAEFDTGLADFHDFLGRIEIHGRRGFSPPKLAPPDATDPSKEATRLD
jgi:hypothetical protein